MLNHISALFCGFSIFSSLILLLGYLLFLPEMRKTPLSKLFSALLLLAFVAIQFQHACFFLEVSGYEPLNQSFYLYLLLVAPSLFYGFSRTVLFADNGWTCIDAAHLAPLIIGLFLPIQTLSVYSFMVGTGYTLWMFLKVFELRSQSRRFHFELFFFALFALMAVAALLLGLSIPYIDRSLFYLAYSNSISIAIFLVVAALIIFPDIKQDIVEVLESAYTNSKLQGINIDAKIAQLEHLMAQEKIYQEENLDLAGLADMLDLSAHQLSELVNGHFSTSFPKYIRQYRVEEARQLLIDEPNTSVLAISMMTGFKSQSSFYTAFHEFTGKSPGKYRKEIAALTKPS